MILKEETIATPGFAGFVPSLKYQFGLTYGNAFRHIMQTDPSLKHGEVRREQARKVAQLRAERQSVETRTSGEQEQEYVWKKGNKYATADDRFSFPPVPGYTGYIPRSQEHFGRPYVETTNASLADFMSMLKSKSELPGRIQAIKNQEKPKISARPGNNGTGGSSSSSGARGSDGNAKAKSDKLGTSSGGSTATDKPSFAYSAASSPIDDKSPYKMPSGHPEKTFISGYTGFVPRLQNHFGEPYSDSVRKAIDEFTAPRTPKDPYKEPHRHVRVKNVAKTSPIPGFTGFIPGSKYGFATTFGKTTEIAYENFNKRGEKGRVVNALGAQIPIKHLAESQPIPGYKGHIPNYIFAAERSYGVSSKECIQEFERQKKMDAVSICV